jgi:hypothetical protein
MPLDITKSTKLNLSHVLITRHPKYYVLFSLLAALPRFVLSLRRETVRRGEIASFLCEAEGDMPMQIMWRHNGIQISHEMNKK